MKIIQHGKHIERDMRRVYSCNRCGCVFMPESNGEEMWLPDKKDYTAMCPDCGKASREYRVENRVVKELTGDELREYFEGKS